MMSHADTVSSAASGSTDALAELYREHAGGVYAVALRLTASRDEADDVLQDVFVGLPRALARYQERGQFGAWIKRIAARTALMRMRRRRARREEPMDVLDVMPESRDAQPLNRIALERAVRALPASLRTVFVLKEVVGYRHEEIAALLGISSGAAATRLSRAWTMLRKELSP